MRFYTKAHRHYCGIDLHARTMYVCMLTRKTALDWTPLSLHFDSPQLLPLPRARK